jgi:hypothetical protein
MVVIFPLLIPVIESISSLMQIFLGSGRYIILGLLLWKLSQKVTLLPSHFSDLRFNHFLKSGKYMLPLILCRS